MLRSLLHRLRALEERFSPQSGAGVVIVRDGETVAEAMTREGKTGDYDPLIVIRAGIDPRTVN